MKKKRLLKKNELQNAAQNDYTIDGNLACQKKGASVMTSQNHIYIKGSMHDENGIWIVRARVPDPETGKKVQKSKSTGFRVKDNTKRKAELAMKGILAQWEQEANVKLEDRGPLFSEYVRKFLEKKEREVRANTLFSYSVYADVYILPAIGNRYVKELSRQDVQALYNALLERGLSVNSVRKIAVVVAGALHMAVLDGVIPINIAKNGDIELPNAKRFRSKAYTKEQVEQLMATVEKEGEPIRCAVTLATFYGLRRSEVCGLRWTDIDFEKMEMRIQNTTTQNGVQIYRDQATKTEKSNRTLSLIPITVPYLKELRESQKARGLKLDKVCRHTNGNEVQPNCITRKFTRMLERYKLPRIRFHDLRGTAASLLAPCVTPKQLQEFMGHEKISTTMEIYVKANDSDRKAVASAMEGIWK